MPETPGAADVVAALRAENAELTAENAELRAQITELAERVARLERLISRNSGNSSMPPSTDDLPGKKPPERKPRRGSGGRPGKQRGAPGAHLAWSDEPDQTVDVFPAGRCDCGADLAGGADLGVRYSHQVTDLPEARAETTQYDRHEVECSCGSRHVADAPPGAAGAPGTVTYGLNFQAWCVFLLVMHHVPVERCAGILESMSGTRPSDGWVHALLDRAAKAVAAANKTIRALILLARVICGDETPVRAGPGRRPARSTCRSRAPACSPITSSATGTWPPSRTSSTATCTARSSCTTGTSITIPSAGSATSCAASITPTPSLCRYRREGAGGRGCPVLRYRHNHRASRKARSWSGGW